MLLIIAHHYVVNSGLTATDGPIFENPMSGKSVFLLLFGMWGKTGINCFVLITGYFMCKNKITVKKFAKLLLEVYFYRFVIYAIFLVIGYSTFSLVSFTKLFFPVTNISDGFTGCFLMFYLTIPFRTLLVQNMTKKQHQLLLLLCGTMYVVIGTIPGFGIRFNYVSWFGVLFLIASYLRFYPMPGAENSKLWGGLALASVAVSMCSVLFMHLFDVKFGHSGLHYWFVADSNKTLAVATAVTSFMFFKNLKMKNSKLINSVAASAFGVLLIHANSDIMRQWLWKDLLDNVGAYNTNYLYIHAITSVIGIFAVCVVLDKLRVRFIEKPFFHWLEGFGFDVLNPNSTGRKANINGR